MLLAYTVFRKKESPIFLHRWVARGVPVILIVFCGVFCVTGCEIPFLSDSSIDGIQYFHPNHVGSIKLITDKDGNRVGEYFYSPYGEIQSGFSSGTDISKYKYTGQQEDASTGLYYYKARFYDPGVGRFLTADSVLPNFADTQAFNRYMYVEGNPVNHNDPSGHRFGGGFWKKITEKAVRCAIKTGVNIVKNAPEVIHKVQSSIGNFAWNAVNGLRNLPVALDRFARNAIEDIQSVRSDITMLIGKAANSIHNAANSIMESGRSLIYEIIEGANNTVFSHSWRTEQW